MGSEAGMLGTMGQAHWWHTEFIEETIHTISTRAFLITDYGK